MGGNLPDGLTLSSDGTITGVPTTAGTYTFMVKAVNSMGSASKNLTIRISNFSVPSIDTWALTGNVSYPFNDKLTASGTKPITWSIISGDFPGSLTLNSNGTITGTPTTQGKYIFTVQAANLYGTDTKQIVFKRSPVNYHRFTCCGDCQ